VLEREAREVCMPLSALDAQRGACWLGLSAQTRQLFSDLQAGPVSVCTRATIASTPHS